MREFKRVSIQALTKRMRTEKIFWCHNFFAILKCSVREAKKRWRERRLTHVAKTSRDALLFAAEFGRASGQA